MDQLSRVVKNIGTRSGIYELRCTRCKSNLTKDTESDWSDIWWWSRIAEDRWEYKEHIEDEGLLDLRGFCCLCKDDMRALYWIYSKERCVVKYFKMRIEGDERDLDYIVEQLNAFAKEKKWNIKIE